MKKQQGSALAISLVLMIILTFLGFNIASRGKLSTQITKTSARYEAVMVAAEDEMYNLLNALMVKKSYTTPGDSQEIDSVPTTAVANGVVNNRHKEIMKFWSSEDLAAHFGTVGLPQFSDFSAIGWRDHSGEENQINTEYGVIRTVGFVQELVNREVSSDINNRQIEVQYLVTVKAFALNNAADITAANNASATSQSKNGETVVIQSVYGIRFSL